MNQEFYKWRAKSIQRWKKPFVVDGILHPWFYDWEQAQLDIYFEWFCASYYQRRKLLIGVKRNKYKMQHQMDMLFGGYPYGNMWKRILEGEPGKRTGTQC